MAGRSPSPISSSAAAAPALIPLGHHAGKPAIPLVRPVTLIGSRSNARIHLTSSSVSKAHALIVRDGNTTYVRDLNSRNYVYVNGEKVREHDLSDGDLIKIGSFSFKFKSPAMLSGGEFGPAPAARLQVTDSEYPVPIDQRVLLIGRRRGSDIHLLEESVSTAHAVILEMNGQRHVRDLGSRTGTHVNGVAVHQHQLNAGDSVRVGDTTLTYLPGAAQLPGEADQIFEDELTSGSASGLHIIDDTAAPAAEELQIDAVDLSPAPPHLGAQPDEDAQFEIAGAVDEDSFSKSASHSGAAMPPASIDNAADALPLSDSPENLSAPEPASDSEPRTEDAASEDAGTEIAGGTSTESPEEILPRRGWRTAPASEDDSPDVDSPPDDSPPGQQDESVLRFAEQNSSSETIDEPNLNLGADENSGDGSTAVLDVEPDSFESESSNEAPILNVDLSSPPGPEFPAAKPAEELDLSALSREAESTFDEVEIDLSEADLATPSMLPNAAPSAPAMRFDQESPVEPLIESDAIPTAPIELPASKPEKVAANRTRRKPKQQVAEQTTQTEPAEEAKPSRSKKKSKRAATPELPVSEIVEPTEPTPESALDLDAATNEVVADSIETSEPAESLTDTALSRAMNDLGGDTGEIIEAGSAATTETDEASETQPTSEPAYTWGANQENFLGSAPVTLPSSDHAGDALQEVNALIDEILAPGENDSNADELLNEYGAITAENGEVTAEEREGLDLSPSRRDEENQSDEDRPAARSIPPMPMPSIPPAPSMPLTPAQSRPVVPIPPPPSRGARRRRREAQTFEPVGSASVGNGSIAGTSNGVRDDERIPPYVGTMPATAGRVTTAFDGLAMPPVREADVFFQMSPPATEDDPFAGVNAATSAALTPMDLVQADESAPAGRSRRAPITGRATVPPDLFFGSAPANGSGGSNGGNGAPNGSLSGGMLSGGMLAGGTLGGSAGRTTSGEVGGATSVAEAPIEFSPSSDFSNTAAPAVPRRGRLRPAMPGMPVPGQEPVASPESVGPSTAHEEFESLAEMRRRRSRRIATILVGGLLLWIGSAAGIFYFLPVLSMTEAPIRFDHYDQLKEGERRQLQTEEQALLSNEATRFEARRLLVLKDPEVSPGFLDDPESYLAAASLASWPESKNGVMVLRHRGRDEVAEKARLFAMAQALFNANKPRIDAATAAEARNRELLANLEKNKQLQQQLSDEIDKLRTQGDSAPDAAGIKKIQDDISSLDKAWSDALLAVKAAETELAQLRQSGDANAANGNSPATNPTNSAAAGDEKITQLSAQLKDLSAKMTAAQSAKAEQASAAKKLLDDSLGDFEKQIAATKELMKDSPELASYVAAAQQLQDTTRQLIDDLIRRQEQQYSRLNELKTTLTEKMEQKRFEQENADPQLKELNERLETARRQLNAAKSAGMKKEADDQQAQVDLLSNLVKSRQEQLPKDALKDFAETIAQLQQIIDVTQKNVEDDRKRTDGLLAQLQKSFTSSQTVEKLPEAQKSAASELEKRLAEINAAREKYNQAISATAVNEDDSTKAMRTQIAALQTDIDSRMKELADASLRNQSQQQQKGREEQISQKENQLADLKRAESDAQLARMNREKDLRDAQTAQASAHDNADRLQQLQDQKTKLESQLAQDDRDQKQRRDEADRAVKPVKVSEDEIKPIPGADNRSWYILAATVAVFVAMGTALFFSLHGSSAEMVGGRAGAMFSRSGQRPIEQLETPLSDNTATELDQLDEIAPTSGDTPHEDANPPLDDGDDSPQTAV